MTIRWGIIGAGGIGGQFASALSDAHDAQLTAVASRDLTRAKAFAAEFGARRAYGSYDELFADDAVDVVYIATLHPHHVDPAIAAARAGKHILCEKPLAMNGAQAQRIVDAAQSAGVFLMEAFMYRCHPQIAGVLDALHAGTIGEPRLVRASFGFLAPYEKRRLFDPELGGGAILDIGCYPASMARIVAGGEPDEVTAVGHLSGGVDEWSAATLRFASGLVAQLACATRVQLDNAVEIYGSEGSIRIPFAWGPEKVGPATITVNGRAQDYTTGRNLYAHQADLVAECIAAGRTQALPPAPTWDDTIGNMYTLDRWREAIGLRYSCD